MTGVSELIFPDYDGNGTFGSLGNGLVNSAVALLFIDFDTPRRLRVNGVATLILDGPASTVFAGARRGVRVQAEMIFPNRPRYVHRMQLVEPSPYVPREGTVPRCRHGSAWMRFATCYCLATRRGRKADLPAVAASL